MAAIVKQPDVVIIGGGLAGLTAATLLAREGRRVTVFERSESAGGRARTESRDRYLFNLGPHALYRKGAGATTLRALGVPFHGGAPPTNGGYAVHRGRPYTLPVGLVSLLTTGLVGVRGKIELARLLSSFPSVDPGPWQDRPVASWLATIADPIARQMVASLLRVTSYTHAPGEQSAGAGIEQLQLALAAGVLYLDGGWQTLVDGLRALAAASGVELITGIRVTGIEHDAQVRGIRLADGSTVTTRFVLVAASAEDVRALVGADVASRIFGAAGPPVPVKAACLTIGLSELPRPRVAVAFGVDRPVYLSVHSAVARLAPEGGAVVHLARYLDPADPVDPRQTERELESLLDLVQAGWRSRVAVRQFLPAVTVSHGLVRAATGGTRGRPNVRVESVSGLYLAGDWVGPAGQLADAAFASAREAAASILSDASVGRVQADLRFVPHPAVAV